MAQPVTVEAFPPPVNQAADSAAAAPVSVAEGQRPAGAAATGSDHSPASAASAHHAASDPAAEARANGLVYLSVDAISSNPHQPRQQFDVAALEKLAESIKADGLMQPIVVRPTPGSANGDMQIVAGERRWRAARLAGLATIPAIVRELDDQQMAEWALIENLQREDLNPIERAEAFQRLTEDFGLSHERVADRVGLERSTISNLLRLLSLCDHAKQLVRDGLLSMGQARAIAGLSDPAQQKHVAELAVRKGLSVREVEKAVRGLAQGHDAALTTRSSASGGRSAYLADLEKQIGEQLGTRVAIRAGRKKGSGKLTIEFFSLDQFDHLLSRMGVQTD
jgi:ParB family chromosome partitioning protein